jgi:hypothetical protein
MYVKFTGIDGITTDQYHNIVLIPIESLNQLLTLTNGKARVVLMNVNTEFLDELYCVSSILKFAYDMKNNTPDTTTPAAKEIASR